MNNTNNTPTGCSLFKGFLLIVAGFVVIKVMLTIFTNFEHEIADAVLLGGALFLLSLYAWPKETKAAAKKFRKDFGEIFGCKSKCDGTGDSKKS